MLSRSPHVLTLLLALAGSISFGYPLVWDSYLRYLNVQVEEVTVPHGATYWRVAEGYAVPPPDQGFGETKITYRAIDENGSPLSGATIRVFSAGGTLQTSPAPGEFIMGGGNWGDFYNQIGPYWLEVQAAEPSEVCKGLGLPVNLHFSYTIVFQRAIRGVTPTGPQPTKLGQPAGENLIYNPGAENEFRGWSNRGMILDGDIYRNCGNRAGSHRFTWQTYGGGTASMEQSVTVTPGATYTFGFWVCKKSVAPQLTLTASWSDNAGGSGTLYTMPGSETIFPIYGTRQDATFVPQGDQVTVRLDMQYTGSEFAAFHLDEFWLVEVPVEPVPVSSALELY